MPATTTEVKSYIHNRVDAMSGPDALKVLEFIDSLKADEPNEETVAAFEEAERLLRDPSVKRYANVAELFAELRAECIES